MKSKILINKKKNNFLKILFIILIIFIIIFLAYKYFKVNVLENFEDKFNDHETYEEIYDKEFIDWYEIIYRDYYDIDNDLDVIYKKTLENVKNENDVNFLVCGCGVGKLCKKLKEKFKNVVGVDISENMLKKGQSIYPNVKFVRGNINKSNIFNKNQFTHIIIDERTLYYNDLNSIKNIIKNTFVWLKEEGYLIVPVYEITKLNPASRYYTTKYIDDKGNSHGFTYLNDFSHDCYYIKEDENIYSYYDKIILDTGNKRIKKTKFYIYSKEVIYDIILNNWFELVYIENIRVQISGNYELAIFKKKKTFISVDELEKNKLL